MANRLSRETSPYLLQHASNPVDWYPWGEEAFARARAEDKPILLSVGYSSCHWCHVMEHESFEHEDTARLMNEHFINVKVDREERPDVDAVYMAAVQALTGRGGWPMTVFLTPDGEPFYGGTYYPPTPRHGLPAFRDVLRGVARAYRTQPDAVRSDARRLREAVEAGTRMVAPVAGLDTGILDRAYRAAASQYDPHNGGFGGAPKFPQPMALEFLLRHHVRTGDANAIRIVLQSLQSMAAGGIYDQVGGGFHRYSVDARWLVPHFEKMLYDNALLARVYLYAFHHTGEAWAREVAEDVLAYVRREMTSPEGAFYSAQDADSEGEEGKFFVWTPDEIDEIVGATDGAVVREFYGVTEVGNFEGRNILHVAEPIEEFAATVGRSVDEVRDTIARARAALYEARARRVWPARDDKVITSWNALMLHTYAVAAWVLDREEYRIAATRNAEFVLRELRPGGRLMRTWRDGRAHIEAFLEDYALLGEALLALYGATFEPRWAAVARELADELLDHFWDEDAALFHDARADDPHLVIRPRDVTDNATPSGTSAAASLLLRLAAFTGESRYFDVAEQVLTGLGRLPDRAPLGFGYLLCALDFRLASPKEVVIAGDPAGPDTRALLDVVRERYRPNLVVALARPDQEAGALDALPLLRDRHPVNGRAAAYVCERFVCQAPVAEPDRLRTQLDAP
ncbi:MAG TPA: thioredoxin domain-containing protein [Longimicrobiales bacterium]|nr:thioredoxin domain-containing protein [Longimicrobiales bacterium]